MSTTSRTPGIWDLDDHSGRPVVQETVTEQLVAPRPNRGAPIAAVAGALALAAAAVPAVPLPVRWPLVAALGVVAVAAAVVSLRRRQAMRGVVTAAAGAVLPVLAVALVLLLPGAPPLLQNARLEAAPAPVETAVAVSPQLAGRPAGVRATARTAAQALALHLRAIHGVAGPYPLQLDAVDGTVVERGGLIDGVRIGAIPEGMHIRYAVADDGRSFDMRVALDADDGAAATASSRIRTTLR